MSEPKRKIKVENTTTINREVYDTLVIDRSSSMGFVRDATIEGINKYVNDLKAESKRLNMTTFVSVILFDTNVETILSFVPVEEVPELTTQTYVPNGMTALADGMGTAITALRERLAGREGADEVDVTITTFTDGAENCSRTYSMSQIQNLTKELEETYKWTFTLVGAGAQQAVQAAAAQFGIAASNTTSYAIGGQGVTSSFATMSMARSAKMADYSAGYKSSIGYFVNQPEPNPPTLSNTLINQDVTAIPFPVDFNPIQPNETGIPSNTAVVTSPDSTSQGTDSSDCSDGCCGACGGD